MGSLLSSSSITNGLVTISVGTDMRVSEIKKNADGFNLWSNTTDTIAYKDIPNGDDLTIDLKNATWTITSELNGTETFIKGIASVVDSNGVTFSFDFRYLLEDGLDRIQVKSSIVTDEEMERIRGVSRGRVRTNLINRTPRVVFQRGVAIDYLEYASNGALQAVWTGDVTPVVSTDSMGGDSINAVSVTTLSGTTKLSKSVSNEDWTESQYLFFSVRATAVNGANSIKLFWVSNGVRQETPIRNIDEAEPLKEDWRIKHLRHFYLGDEDRSNITEFGIEFVGTGGTFILDEAWRYKKDDFLPDYIGSNVNFYDDLPFFNTGGVPWDRRQSEEAFILSYADETSVAGNILGVAWVGRWNRTTDVTTVESDSSSNSFPLDIGGQMKYLTLGLSGKKWFVDWFVLPMDADISPETMYTTANTLYTSLFNLTTFRSQEIGKYIFQPYIWNSYDSPVEKLAPDLRRAAAAGFTDLIVPMGNSGWSSYKPRFQRFDLANIAREKSDNRIEFLINMWLDPDIPERRVHFELTIFDNHHLKDNLDETTVSSNTTTAEARVFVYEAADQEEIYIRRALSPLNLDWFEDQVVDGKTYVFSYQYPVFRPSIAHVAYPGNLVGKTFNLHDKTIASLEEVVRSHDITGIVFSEYFWYRRAFDDDALALYNTWRTSQGLDTLSQFETLDPALPPSSSNHFKADDTLIWNWKSSEFPGLSARLKAAMPDRSNKLWVNSNVDNILSIQDETSPIWTGGGVINGTLGIMATNTFNVPVGPKSLSHRNARFGTDFDVLRDDPNLDFIWFWNYWGYARVESILEFILFYCKKKEIKDDIIADPGVYPRSTIPAPSEFETVIRQLRQYDFRIAVSGHRNMSEDHWLALEAAMTEPVGTKSCPVTKKVTGKKKFSEFDNAWNDDQWKTPDNINMDN